jgi:hypothetical protein
LLVYLKLKNWKKMNIPGGGAYICTEGRSQKTEYRSGYKGNRISGDCSGPSGLGITNL